MLYGRVLSRKKNQSAVVLAGLSAVRGTRCGEFLYPYRSEFCFIFCDAHDVYEKVKYSTIGIPLEFRWFMHTHFAGFGLNVHADVPRTAKDPLRARCCPSSWANSAEIVLGMKDMHLNPLSGCR